MKKIILIITIISICSCKAQTIVPYYSEENIFVKNSGDYYKDVDNDFNPFIGTWKWEDGGNSLTLILKKEENIFIESVGYFKDLLVGEYQYIEGGVELVNTLSNISNPTIIGRQHIISGMLIMSKYNRPTCEDCAESERRIKLNIKHPDSEYIYDDLILRYVNDIGGERIEAILFDGGSNVSNYDGEPINIDVPFGNYSLIKID